MMNLVQMCFQILGIIFSFLGGVFMIYIQWIPESVRSGREVRPGSNIQEAINKVAGLKSFRSDRWYIKWGLTLLAIGIIFQMLGLFAFTWTV